jgi:hypothetical protein
MMSDRTRQGLDERVVSESLYRAVRAAQRAVGAPVFKRQQVSKVRASVRDELLALEQRDVEIALRIDDTYRELLRTYGMSKRGYSAEEQMRRPGVFWPERLREMNREEREAYHDSATYERLDALRNERTALTNPLFNLRKVAGLKHGERLDPATGKVVR